MADVDAKFEQAAGAAAHLRVAVLLPCYNEEAAIAQTVAGFRAALPGADIYVYDNNSKDGTRDVAAASGAIVRSERMQGKGNVVRRMFADVDADIYVMADGDATYDAAAAPALIAKLVGEQLDMVVGARKSEIEEAYRRGHRWGNRVFTGILARAPVSVAEEPTPVPSPTAAWRMEPALHDESEYTPWAEPGWHSWNDMSPELEFCEFAGEVVRVVKPSLIVETGVGQGFTTRRMARHLGAGRLVCHEADEAWRRELREVDFFAAANVELSEAASPTEQDLASASLTVLDSDFPVRREELQRWVSAAAPGALLLVHDCGNGHDPATGHAQMRALIEEQGIAGTFMRNPRGSFLGVQSVDRNRVADLEHRAEAAEAELRAVRATRSYRYMAGPRELRRIAGAVKRRLFS